jgi:hypothetical protein
MASFYTTVSRIGQLAGGLDVAQKTKEKEIAAKNEQIRQFNLGLTKDYDIAKMDLAGKNQRNLNTNLTTLGSAKIRAGGKGSLKLNDFDNLNDVITSNIMGLGVLDADYFDSDGNIKSGYGASLGTLQNIIRDKIINSGVQNDMGAIQGIITDTVSQLGPSVSKIDKNLFTENTGGELSFGGQVGDQIRALQNQYKKPETDQPTFIKNLRQRLMQEYKSAPLVNQIINMIIAGN